MMKIIRKLRRNVNSELVYELHDSIINLQRSFKKDSYFNYMNLSSRSSYKHSYILFQALKFKI